MVIKWASENSVANEGICRIIWGCWDFMLNLHPKYKLKESVPMPTMPLNSELFRQLSFIADDEDSMRKVLNAVKRIVAGRNVPVDGFVPREKNLLRQDFEEALADAKAYKEIGADYRPAESLLDEL